MTAKHTEELSDDMKLMRRYDADWSGPRLITQGAIWLAIAIGVIFALATAASAAYDRAP